MAQSRLLIDLPDTLLYNILSYVKCTTNTAITVASLTTLSKYYHHSIEERDELWEIILCEYDNSFSPSTSTSLPTTQKQQQNAAKSQKCRRQRRESKRLRRTTAKQDVQSAHRNLIARTDSAILALAEMAHSSSGCSQPILSLARLRGVIHTFGPILRIDHRANFGGTMLVEVLRARHVSENVILRCVTELITVHHANPNTPAAEGHGGYVGKELPPLVVAAARGMDKVVKYLVCEAHARITEVGTSRFRLFVNAKKSVKGTYTPLQFAVKMREAELEHGAVLSDVKGLNLCIRILEQAGRR